MRKGDDKEVIIKMNNDATAEGSCIPQGPNLLQFTFKGEIPAAELLESVELQNQHGIVFGRYEGYDTVYKELENGYILSNDGSVYVEPPEPEPYVPTMDELKATKKQEVGTSCEQIIYAGVDVELENGVEHFALTEKDQINLFGKQAQLAAGVEQLEYHQDGHSCRYYTAAEMQRIIEAAMFHVSYHTTYCNSLNMWIAAAETEEELAGIFYGADIPAQYISVVLADYLEKIVNTV